MKTESFRIYKFTLLCWFFVPVVILFLAWAMLLGAVFTFFDVSAEAKVYSLIFSTFGLSILGLLCIYFREKKQRKSKETHDSEKDLEIL